MNLKSGCKNKLPILEAIMEKYGLDFSVKLLLYMMTNPDICGLRKVALAACPADAVG